MHIAIVSETFPPEINGVALTVQEFLLGLRSLGHEVSLARPRQTSDQGEFADDELLVRGAGIPRYPGLRFGFPARGRLMTQWRQRRPDAVYVATEGPLGWSAVRAARALRIPVATGFHTRFDDYASRYGLGFLAPTVFAWMRHFHNRADATLVPTLELQRFLGERRFDNVTLLRRAVDTERFAPSQRSDALRAQWGLSADDVVVIHVGRVAPEKNLALALRAFRSIQVRQPTARFVFVGDGPARSAIQAANPDLIFAGTQRGDALTAHFASADLFLFPSLSETFGNVTLEAMASGVATVAYDYGAAHEHLRSGVSGDAVRCGDEAQFIACAVRLAEDRALRDRYSAAARNAILALSPATVASDLAALLGSLQKEQAA